jgi:hypothetical protein
MNMKSTREESETWTPGVARPQTGPKAGMREGTPISAKSSNSRPVPGPYRFHTAFVQVKTGPIQVNTGDNPETGPLVELARNIMNEISHDRIAKPVQVTRDRCPDGEPEGVGVNSTCLGLFGVKKCFCPRGGKAHGAVCSGISQGTLCFPRNQQVCKKWDAPRRFFGAKSPLTFSLTLAHYSARFDRADFLWNIFVTLQL